jgi:hypothetical protein
MFQTAASTPPVPEAVRMIGSPSVWNNALDFSVTPLSTWVNVSLLWLTIDLIIAWFTLSGTFVGPGSMRSLLRG